MSREGERFEHHIAQGKAKMPATLCAVRDEADAFGQERADAFEIGAFSRHVGCGRHDRERGIASREGYDVLRAEFSVPQRRDGKGDPARLLQREQRAQDGIVFEAGRDYMVSLVQRSEQGDVERFRAVFGEDHPFVTVSAEQIGKEVPAREDALGAGEREFMSAPSRVSARFHGSENGILYACGLEAARGGVIQIDQSRPPEKKSSYYTKAGKQS